MSRRLYFVRNDSGSPNRFFDQVLANGEEWEIIDRKLDNWRDDATVSGSISSGTLSVGDGSQFFGPFEGEQYFYEDPKPTTIDWPSNSLVDVISGTNLFGGTEYTFLSKAFRPIGFTVTSGIDGLELTVNHPTVDLADDTLLTVSSGTDPEGVAAYTLGTKAVVGDFGVTVISGADTVTISGGTAIGQNIGNFFQIEFSSVGITNNTWLSVSSKDLTSNITPWPVVFPCRIAGLGYSNEREGSDCNIELHVAAAGDTNNNAAVYTWAVTDSRIAFKSDFGLSEIVLNPGDKLAIFGSNAGDIRPKNMFLGVYVEIIQRADDEDSEDFSGDFV